MDLLKVMAMVNIEHSWVIYPVVIGNRESHICKPNTLSNSFLLMQMIFYYTI